MKLARNAFFTTARRVFRSRRTRRLRSGSLLVLNFHKVEPEPNDFWWPVHPRVFEEFVRWIVKRYRVRTFFGEDEGVPGRIDVVLSFDDGYASFLEYVAPVLQRHDIRANLNVIPSCTQSGVPPWNARLYDFLNRGSQAALREFRIEGFPLVPPWRSAADRKRYGLKISRYLKNMPRARRESLLAPVSHLLDDVATMPGTTRMMGVSELESIRDVVEIGAHSFGHDTMAYESEAFFAADFRHCADYFRQELGIPVSIYAFPQGSYRPNQIDFLTENGVEFVLLVDERIAHASDRVVPRLTMYGSSVAELELRALGYGSAQGTGDVRN